MAILRKLFVAALIIGVCYVSRAQGQDSSGEPAKGSLKVEFTQNAMFVAAYDVLEITFES